MASDTNNEQKKNKLFTDLSFINQEAIIAIADEKIINEANEHLRFKKIYEQFPDHCIQFFFLS
jgi:hypothetical protein